MAEVTATATVMTAAAMAGGKKQQSTSVRTVDGGWWTRARRRVTTNNKSVWPMMRAGTKMVARAMATVTRVAGERATATMVKKRSRAARAMVNREVGDEEGDGDGGNMARNNNDSLIPVIVQQPVLYSSYASLDNGGDVVRALHERRRQ